MNRNLDLASLLAALAVGMLIALVLLEWALPCAEGTLC